MEDERLNARVLCRITGEAPGGTPILDRFLHLAEVLRVARECQHLASREKPSKETKALNGAEVDNDTVRMRENVPLPKPPTGNTGSCPWKRP
jgi:hypothetical protein